MNANRLYLPAFIGLCILYLALPSSLIWRQERILREGAVYRFRLEPVDPADAFRGRYLDLNLNVPAFPMKDSTIEYGQKLFIALERDAAGLAQFASLHKTPPTDKDYLSAYLSYFSEEEVFVYLSDETTRYYLNEKLAPLADKWYAELLNQTERDTALVTLDLRVRKGKALIEQVYFEGMPVEEYIRKKEAE
ncbi:MAG: GDYXXLXY domain-containing protein [Saprospiraceae bacterium]|nr:GDYXXLXY domain-containing protein [Saprospiraceae bacterium]